MPQELAAQVGSADRLFSALDIAEIAESGKSALDVTSEVRAGHRAFSLLPTGADGVTFASREDPNLDLRPRLLLWRGAVRTMPTSIVGRATCSVDQPDQTAQIQAWLDSVPDGSVARFPAGRCFRTEVPLLVVGRRGLTIDGNGSTLEAFTAELWSSRFDARRLEL